MFIQRLLFENTHFLNEYFIVSHCYNFNFNFNNLGKSIFNFQKTFSNYRKQIEFSELSEIQYIFT